MFGVFGQRRRLGSDSARPARPAAPRPGRLRHRQPSTARASITNATWVSSARTSPAPTCPSACPATSAIGHTRYATQGGTILRNVQPLFADLALGGFAIAHNGNLTNSRDLRERLVEDGAIFQSTSDTECILQLIARSRRAKVVDRFVEALHDIQGAYALVCLTNDMMIGARDPIGIRPLVLGERAGAPILASETCALDMIGAKFVRTIEPGEVVVDDARAKTARSKLESHFPVPAPQSAAMHFRVRLFRAPGLGDRRPLRL